ncbi:hypothetical protein E1B28_006323 [Marasmius oreades]|uniref:Cytochrome P450 n=1 Tax=Marasmius oreades TaxID=181124 RepID=A0A9P7S800_9AGAR|nr:uncharacterized protein E1B28_006323 [Marasmius oreades]KAG7095593.1 hypothetical protein E1B28_006323 [Marasmius oreades]
MFFTVCGCFALSWSLFLILRYKYHSSSPLPPGPAGSLPILGVLRIHPKTEFWKTYSEWAKRYGPGGLISFHLLGRRIIVVQTKAVADDLFTKRSSCYSDRPFPPMSGKLMKREKSMFYISYNERCKMYRKLMQQVLNSSASQAYWTIEEEAAKYTVNKVLESPEKLFQHLRRNAAFIIMKVAYGYTISDYNDHFVAIAEDAMRIGSLVAAPGKWLVDSLPILRFLPDWFPGAGFKRQAKAWSEHMYLQSLEPHVWVKDQMVKGSAVPSFTSNLLQDANGAVTTDKELDDVVLWTAGALYAAGADTTVSAMRTFLFCMLMYPSVQEKAHAELDRFVEDERRLPTLKDWSQGALPYLTSILLEVLRWHPPAPMGLFHSAAHDDIYKGYLIPAKTTIIGNIWGMMHDESVYPNPDVFDPDRFTGIDGRKVEEDPRQVVFGFGRRVCPGLYVAEASIWIQMALMLACLRIEKAADEHGRVLEPEVAFTTAIVSYVKPFPYRIVTRRGVELLN